MKKSVIRIKIARITNQLAQLHQKGYQIVLVTSQVLLLEDLEDWGLRSDDAKLQKQASLWTVGQGL